MRIPEHMGLGAAEYYIFDEEEQNPSETNAIIKSSCAPFMVQPSFKMVPIGVQKGQYPTAVIKPTATVPYRPGFLSPSQSMANLELGFYEVVSPDGGTVASFQCRPYYASEDLAIKEVSKGMQKLVQQGAAEFPEGTTRLRMSKLHTVKR